MIVVARCFSAASKTFESTLNVTNLFCVALMIAIFDCVLPRLTSLKANAKPEDIANGISLSLSHVSSIISYLLAHFFA